MGPHPIAQELFIYVLFPQLPSKGGDWPTWRKGGYWESLQSKCRGEKPTPSDQPMERKGSLHLATGMLPGMFPPLVEALVLHSTNTDEEEMFPLDKSSPFAELTRQEKARQKQVEEWVGHSGSHDSRPLTFVSFPHLVGGGLGKFAPTENRNVVLL